MSVNTDGKALVPHDQWAEGLRTIRAVKSEVQATMAPDILPPTFELPRTKTINVVPDHE
jgi:hypothetical protein